MTKRVKVFIVTEEGALKFLGCGSIVGEEHLQLIDKEGRKIMEITTPKIKLDSGKELLGVECWWIEEDEANRAEIKEFGEIVYKCGGNS